MAGDRILSTLQGGTEKICKSLVDDVREYLSTAPSSVFSKSASSNAVRFIYAINTNFDKLSSTEHMKHVVEVVKICYEFLQEHPSNIVKDHFAVDKAVYQIMYKISKVKLSETAVPAAECLVRHLSSLGKEDSSEISTIAYACYSIFWNAVMFSAPTNQTDIVNLHVIALKFLFLTDKSNDFLMEKLKVSLDKVLEECKLNRDLAVPCRNFCHDVVALLTLREGIDGILCAIYIHLRAMEIHLCIKKPEAMLHDCKAMFKNIVKESVDLGCCGTEAIGVCKDIFELIPKTFLGVRQQSLEGCREGLSQVLHKVCVCVKNFESEKDSNAMTVYTLSICLQSLLDQFKDFRQSKATSSVQYSLPLKTILIELVMEGAKLYGIELTRRKTEGTCGDKQSSNRIINLQTLEIRARSECLTLRLTSFDGVADLTSPKVVSLFKSASQELHAVETCIAAARIFDNTKPISHEEHQRLANLTYRYLKLCYQKCAYKNVMFFLDLTERQFTLWVKEASLQQIERHLVGRKLEIGVISLRKLKKFDLALAAASSAVLIDPSYTQAGVEMWLKVQEESCRMDEHSKSPKTLHDTLQDKGNADLGILQKVIDAEIKAVKGTKSLPYTYFTSLKAAYTKLYSQQPEDAAFLLLEEAQFLWARRDEVRDPATCCQEAVDLLVKLHEDGKKGTAASSFLNDLLARAYLMLYVVKSVDPLEMQDSGGDEENNNEQHASRPSSPVSGLAEAELFGKCCSVDQEAVTLEVLDKALLLWEEIAVCGKAQKEKYKCVPYTLELMTVMLGAYKLVGKYDHVIRSVNLIRSVSQLEADSSQVYLLQAQTQLLQLATEWRQPEVAKQCCEETDKWIEHCKLDKKKHSLHYTIYLVAKAESLLMANDLEQGQDLLKAIQTMHEDHGNTKEDLMADTAVNSVFSQYLLLPQPDLQDSTEKCALEVRVRAARTIGGVICFLLGEWVFKSVKKDEVKVPVNVLQKWQLLDMVLHQLLQTGTLYISFGDARESHCYLQQGIKIAQTFGLPKRLAQFHLAQAQQEYLCDKSNDCAAHVHAVRYLVTSEVPLSKDGDAAKKLDIESREQKPSSASDDSIDEQQENGGEFVIQSKPLDLEEELGEQRQSGTESPTRTKRHIFQSPSWWSHDVECDCSNCTDLELNRLTLQHTAIHALLCQLKGDHSAAHELLKQLLSNFDHWTNKAVDTLSSELASLAPSLVSKKTQKMVMKTQQDKTKKLEKISGPVQVFSDEANDKSPYSDIQIQPSMYQELLVDVGLQMLRLAIDEEDDTSYQEWASKVQELLNLDAFPHMLQSHHTALAQYLYLQSVHDNEWPQEGEDDDQLSTSVSQLCEDLESIQITVEGGKKTKVSPSSLKTPVVVSKGNKSPNAPAKAEVHRLVKKSSSSQLDLKDIVEVDVVAGVERQRTVSQRNHRRSASPRKSVENISPGTSPSRGAANNAKTYSMKEFLATGKKNTSTGSKIPSLKAQGKSGDKRPVSQRNSAANKKKTSSSVPTIHVFEDTELSADGPDNVFKTPAKPLKNSSTLTESKRPKTSNVQAQKSSAPTIKIWEDGVDNDKSDMMKTPSKLAKKIPSSSITTPSVNEIIATPKSVANRKAALFALLVESDSEEDLLLPVKTQRGKKSSTSSAKPTKKQAASSKAKPPAKSKHKSKEEETTGHPLSETNEDVALLKPKPTKSLFKAAVMGGKAENEENVFDFVCSDPDSPAPTTARRGRGKKPPTGLKSSQRGRAGRGK